MSGNISNSASPSKSRRLNKKDKIAVDTVESVLEKYKKELKLLESKYSSDKVGIEISHFQINLPKKEIELPDIVKDIEVQCLSQKEVTQYQAKDLISKLISSLSDEYDTSFLSEYLDILQIEDEAAVKRVTCEIMWGIEEALRQSSREALGEQRVVLCAFLCACSLCAVRGARPALRQLLTLTTGHERQVVAAAWLDILPPDALIVLSDAVRAPRPRPRFGEEDEAPSLAELLLRCAFCALPPRVPVTRVDWEKGVPRVEELDNLIKTWGEQEPAEDGARLALVGRVLSVAPSAPRNELLARLDAVLAAQHPDRLAGLRGDRKVGVCKLQILFGAEEKIISTKKIKTKITKQS